ncbi:MAG: class I SAM-dependent methyltransferase [Gemmatimonadota bacterium]
MKTCGCCGASDLECFTAREHFTGTGEPFEYGECGSCGAIQRLTHPTDISAFYGRAYAPLARSRWKQLVRTTAYRIVYRGGLAGRVLAVLYPGAHAGVMTALREPSIRRSASILDVGSGTGRFLVALRALGFDGPMLGIDPYVESDAEPVAGIRIRRCSLEQVEHRYDLITFVHSLEHMENSDALFATVVRLLNPGGCCIIAVPIAGSAVWREAGVNWVQLDPPRHVLLHTPTSLELVAGRHGFAVEKVIPDSTAFQFWGTALVQRRIAIVPLWKPYLRSLWRMPFDALRAARMNRAGLGDQATFILRHSPAERVAPGPGCDELL